MMLNPLNKRHLEKFDSLEADMITFNLEDAIAPSKKEEALKNCANFFKNYKKGDKFVIVRINPINEGGAKEIEYLNEFDFDAIRVSKVKTPHHVESALNILDPKKELHLSLETKEAFLDIASLKIDKRVTTANLGILDLLNSMKLPQSILKFENPTILYILSKFLCDCRCVDMMAISFMFQDYNDIDSFIKWCKIEKKMGFSAKACMGPKQVEIANKIFGIDLYELKRAKYIKEVFEKNSKKGVHGFMDKEYGFIDEPIYKDALLVLDLVDST